MKTRYITILLLSTLLLAACSSGSSSTTTLPLNSSPTQAEPANVPPVSAPSTQPAVSQSSEMSIKINGFKFDPADTTIKVGTTVTWTNQDASAHTVTADDGSWSSDSLNQGATYSRTFDQAGNYSYQCSIHPSMVGTIVVQP